MSELAKKLSQQLERHRAILKGTEILKGKLPLPKDVCNFCGHSKQQHENGLGLCSAYTGHFCRCSRYHRPKRKFCACGNEIPVPNHLDKKCQACINKEYEKENPQSAQAHLSEDD